MRLGLAFNQKPTTGDHSRAVVLPVDVTSTHPSDAFVEWDDPATIDAVEHALSAFGPVVRLEAIDDFPERLARSDIDLLFNMAEGDRGPSRESHVPAIAEFLDIPYTASDPLTMALALHKGHAKEIFQSRGIPTAPFVVVTSPADAKHLRTALPFPLFLKPVWEGSSMGVTGDNRVDAPDEAVERAREILATYRQPVLAETYLPGDEFTVAVLGNGADTHALPLIRYRFDALPADALPIMGHDAKWVWDDPTAPLDLLECPARVSSDTRTRIVDIAVAAYGALGCRDWGRVDVRLDRDGTPHVIEVNPLPGIMPDAAENSCFPRAAATAGITYDELIQQVVRIAWRRVTGADSPAPTLAEAS